MMQFSHWCVPINTDQDIDQTDSPGQPAALLLLYGSTLVPDKRPGFVMVPVKVKNQRIAITHEKEPPIERVPALKVISEPAHACARVPMRMPVGRIRRAHGGNHLIPLLP